MDASTRPPQKRHQALRHLALGLVAVLCAAAQIAIASTPQTDFVSSTQSSIKPAPAVQAIAIATVQRGNEGLELSARFSQDSTETVRGVEWSITDSSGTNVFDGITSIAEAKVLPGDYKVAATYGEAHIVQGLSVHEGTKLIVSFVLNAGGLRILPRVKNLGLPHIPSLSKIYALSGTTRGQLVTTSFTPGEIMKVVAGDYRVENRFENGNAVAITDVHVRPGKMSAVNIDHLAGIAHLSCCAVTSENVNWKVTDEQGITFQTTTGANLNLVLQPGTYAATATMPGASFQKTFVVLQGQNIDVPLNN